MIMRIIFFITGIIFISLSISFIIIYINLLNMGYTFLEYVNFIIRRMEVIAFVPGVFLVIVSMLKRKDKMLWFIFMI